MAHCGLLFPSAILPLQECSAHQPEVPARDALRDIGRPSLALRVGMTLLEAGGINRSSPRPTRATVSRSWIAFVTRLLLAFSSPLEMMGVRRCRDVSIRRPHASHDNLSVGWLALHFHFRH